MDELVLPRRWCLWARAAQPYAIPRKKTTTVVEALWRNFKRLILHMYSRPRLDFAVFSLVTQALPPYRQKLLEIIHSPRKARPQQLSMEQAAFKSKRAIGNCFRSGRSRGPTTRNPTPGLAIAVLKSTTRTSSASILSRKLGSLRRTGGLQSFAAMSLHSTTFRRFLNPQTRKDMIWRILDHIHGSPGGRNPIPHPIRIRYELTSHSHLWH